MSTGWELDGIRLEEGSRKTTFCAFKCALSLPVDLVSYPITTAPKVGWGLYRESRKSWRTVVVPVWTSQRDGARACSNSHACRCSFGRERLWQKPLSKSFERNGVQDGWRFFLSERLWEICLKLQVCAEGVLPAQFPVSLSKFNCYLPCVQVRFIERVSEY